MSNYSYSQPNPWSLSVKNKQQKKKEKPPKKEMPPCDSLDTFSTATEALYYKQMLAGKAGKEFLKQYTLSQENGEPKIVPRTDYQPPSQSNSTNNDKRYSRAESSISHSQPSSHQQSSNYQSSNYQSSNYQSSNYQSSNYQLPQPTTKRLGLSGATSKFKNPMCRDNSNVNTYTSTNYNPTNHTTSTSTTSSLNFQNSAAALNNHNLSKDQSPDLISIMSDERAKNLDKSIVEKILNEIIDKKSKMGWEAIGGLADVKNELEEIVILPMKRPDLFTDLLSPCKGLLLFGPPGTGKTLIGKCIASKSDSTFFSISASSLTSKWVGEGEKMVRTLFTIARIKQPSVIFIDEIDSLLTQRTEGEHESSRRIKTEFLVQFDGISTEANENLLVIGATNLPGSLDEAARRRFTKRLYIPLPNLKARKDIISLMMKREKHELTDKQFQKLCRMTKGYSGADLSQLCKDAALNVIRRFGKDKILDIKNKDDLPLISMDDFLNAIRRVKATVSGNDLTAYKQWNGDYGAIQYYNSDDEYDADETMETDADTSCVILN